MPIDQEVSFPCLFLLAMVQEDLGLRAHWISVARLPLNISLAGLIAGLPPSQRGKENDTVAFCSERHTHTHTHKVKEGKWADSLVSSLTPFVSSDLVLF